MKDIAIVFLAAVAAFFVWKHYNTANNALVAAPLPTTTAGGTASGDCFANASESITAGAPETGGAICTNSVFSNWGFASSVDRPVPLRIVTNTLRRQQGGPISLPVYKTTL